MESESKDSTEKAQVEPSLEDLSRIVSTTAGDTGMSLSARFGVEQKHQKTTSDKVKKSAHVVPGNKNIEKGRKSLE